MARRMTHRLRSWAADDPWTWRDWLGCIAVCLTFWALLVAAFVAGNPR